MHYLIWKMIYLICIFATCFERLACLDSISVMIAQQASSNLLVEGWRNSVSHIHYNLCVVFYNIFPRL